MRHVVLWLVLGFAIGGTARAEGLVIESYVGRRPADASSLASMRWLLEELSRRDYVSAGAMIQLESRVSKPALTEAGLPIDFEPQVERGHKAWISGNYAEALQILSPLVQKAHENPGAFQQKKQLREKLFKALLGIAVSQLEQGDKGAAKATFGEILRSFPEQSVARGIYGPDVANEYLATKKELDGQKRGTLIVTLTGDTGPIYINEKLEDAGKVTRTDLYPGEYRVFAAPAKGLTRSHRVSIAPGETVTLTIDTGFDLAVQAKQDWIGLVFESAEDRADNEALYATKLAKLLAKDSVIVVGVEVQNGRRVLVGAIIDMIGRKDLRRASIALDPAPAQRTVVGLAKFLTSGEEAEGIQVQVAGKGGVAVGSGGGGAGGGVDQPSKRGIWGGWKWVSGVTGVAAIGLGAWFVHIEGKCGFSGDPPEVCMDSMGRLTDVNSYGPTGYVIIGGGAALIGVSVFLFVRGDGGAASASDNATYVVPTSGGAMAGYRLRF